MLAGLCPPEALREDPFLPLPVPGGCLGLPVSASVFMVPPLHVCLSYKDTGSRDLTISWILLSRVRVY